MVVFVMHLVIKRTKNVNIKNEHGMTPLHNACLRNGEAVILYLLSNGARPNDVNNQNETSAHIACSAGKLRVVQLLLDYGADLKIKGPDGTPEETAHLAGHFDIVNFLKDIRHRKKTKMRKMKKMGKSNNELISKRINSQRHILTRSNSQPTSKLTREDSGDTEETKSNPSHHRLSDIIGQRSSNFSSLRRKFERFSLEVIESDKEETPREEYMDDAEIVNEVRERSTTIDVSPSKKPKQSHRKRNSSDGSKRRPRRLETHDIFGIKVNRNTVSTQKPSHRLRKDAKTQQKPFAKKITELKASFVFEDPTIDGPLSIDVEKNKSDIINRTKGWHIQDICQTRKLFIDDNEVVSFHYKDNFFDENDNPLTHYNFVGSWKQEEKESPLILSVIVKDSTLWGIMRTEEGDFTFNADITDGKKSISSSKKLIKHLQESSEILRNSKLISCKDTELTNELLAFEKLEKNQFKKISNHKIGVLYVREGQKTEDEILGNIHSCDEFESFLAFLGKKIELRGWQGYDGGLDTKKDRSGKHSVFTKWLDFEIMFHVSTYIPLLTDEEKFVERKKHIGNDMTCIVFLEGDNKFNPSTIASSFLHVFIVVQKQDDNSYKVSVCTRDDVPEFGPPATETVYKKDEVLRDFLLSKIINAERATVNGRWFKSKRKNARKNLLSIMTDKFAQQKK